MSHCTPVTRARGPAAAGLAIGLCLLAAPLAAQPAGKVNVNNASTEELALLPGIGPSVAQRIVEFREQNGPFKSPEDLLLVRGVGDRTFERLEPYVTISGETTLKEKVRLPRDGTGDEEG